MRYHFQNITLLCTVSNKIHQGHEQRLNLDQYNAKTLGRVLDFCYRRTYSDGEYPEIAAPFLLSMTADDVRNALVAPLAVMSDVADPECRADCTQCEASEDSQDDGADEQDENLRDLCEIHSPSDDDLEPLNDEESLISEPAERHGPVKPPYTISLFTNFDVYIAAKELQIPALQLLARQRFSQTLRSYWARIAYLPDLIEHVYLRTDDGDALRALLCQIVAARYDSEYYMDFKAKIREVMVRNGEFAADVLDTALRLRCEWADTK